MVSQPSQPPNQPPLEPAEQAKQQRAWQDAQRKAWEDFEGDEFQDARTDWRTLVSYTDNLSRIGQQLLGTNACWETLSELRPANERRRFLLNRAGSQYPWYWSAAVLAGLFGLSVCILNFRVKSMDRLR